MSREPTPAAPRTHRGSIAAFGASLTSMFSRGATATPTSLAASTAPATTTEVPPSTTATAAATAAAPAHPSHARSMSVASGQSSASASLNRFGEKLGKGLGIARQWTLQKIGQRPTTQESPELTVAIQSFQAQKSGLQEVRDAAQDAIDAEREYFESMSNLAQTLQRLSPYSQDEATAALVQGLTATHVYDTQLVEQLSHAFVDPIDMLLDADVRINAQLVKSLPMQRLNHDEKLDALARRREKANVSADELARVEREEEVAKTEYDASCEVVHKLCSEVVVKSRDLLNAGQAAWVDAKVQHHARSELVWQRAVLLTETHKANVAMAASAAHAAEHGGGASGNTALARLSPAPAQPKRLSLSKASSSTSTTSRTPTPTNDHDVDSAGSSSEGTLDGGAGGGAVTLLSSHPITPTSRRSYGAGHVASTGAAASHAASHTTSHAAASTAATHATRHSHATTASVSSASVEPTPF